MMKDFDGPDELTGWLNENGIDTAVWGIGTFKTVANLWDEYVQGEVYFRADPPLRMIQVVQVLIQHDDTTLIEVEQVFKNGKRRHRNQPPSEKIKPSEIGIDAAYRCLNEELGLSRDQVSEMVADREREEMVTDSPSYPGLRTHYTIQRIKARVTGLPDEDFWRENTAVREGDPVSRHLWAWREQWRSLI
jgi:hypothetical protein